MKINIQREKLTQYEFDLEDATLLEALNEIKINQDASLVYASGCRSSVCGSCAMRVNGKEVLACAYKVQDGDLVEPLKNVPIIRDLVVDMSKAYKFNAKAKAWQSSPAKNISVTQEDEKINEVQSDCILCGACYSACPVYTVNSEFLGPFSLTRVWRYVSDKREDNTKDKIDTIQTNGVWDCTLCNECTIVCPQDISSKADIEKLRAKSAISGHMDPNFGSFGGFGGSFDGSPTF
ncbi:succinate dehydrogenase/fumarate reductase iron-sulfur subunit [Candidatus Sulfurimonas marisnigri]|uniref:Fumarate reductase iron-sulfur subunit n=1 Tax=Candidatus Sulfurimonas marisnigri TaxID=2740405 RepID=A0A7S7M084_9BACT|nr:2Fe-2S iron-sulfur cluster-binding protein [Candidatus Sulfurimonas marisnigri]QOY54711.1 succinate dehydrogenase/fumarate reductase iron-sulfur subunit [Candidatus Sulfurimonas marisnigri]